MENKNKKIRAAFIINPVAGGKDKTGVIEEIKKYIDKDIEYEIIFWEFKKQKKAIRALLREKGFDIAVAVGGDGTVNQVAKAVRYSDTALAIIPSGSGNGLARHLNIPLNIKEAVELIGKGKEIYIDGCSINGKTFFCTAGTGFDAHIGKLFAKSKNRGFISYFKITVGSLLSYKPQKYSLNIDGKEVNVKAFLITFANSAQFGNDAYIAPQADIQDGYIDVCILKPFKVWHIPGLAIKMFKKKFNESSLYEAYRGKDVLVTREAEAPVHYDGEPKKMGTELEIKIYPAALKVIVPIGFPAKNTSEYFYEGTELRGKKVMNVEL